MPPNIEAAARKYHLRSDFRRPDAVDPLLYDTTSAQYCLMALCFAIAGNKGFSTIFCFCFTAPNFKAFKICSYLGYCEWRPYCDPANVVNSLVWRCLCHLQPYGMDLLTWHDPSLGMRGKSEPAVEKQGDIIEICLSFLRSEKLCVMLDQAIPNDDLRPTLQLLLVLLEDASAASWWALQIWQNWTSKSYFNAAI